MIKVLSTCIFHETEHVLNYFCDVIDEAMSGLKD